MTSRALRIALALSLVANLFLVGVLAGGAVWLRGRPGTIAAGSLRVAGSELPQPERKAFRMALRDARRSLRATVEDERRARIQAAALLRTPVLDEVALESSLARIRADDFAIRTVVERRAIAFAATMRPVDRARLGEEMVRRDERRPARK